MFKIEKEIFKLHLVLQRKACRFNCLLHANEFIDGDVSEVLVKKRNRKTSRRVSQVYRFIGARKSIRHFMFPSYADIPISTKKPDLNDDRPTKAARLVGPVDKHWAPNTMSLSSMTFSLGITATNRFALLCKPVSPLTSRRLAKI